MYKTLCGNLLTLIGLIIGKPIKRLYNDLIINKNKVSVSSLFIVFIVENNTKQVIIL